MWHSAPKNDAWREVHLAHVESLGNRLWLRCDACGHSITPEPRELANEHQLDMETPLLLIARRLKCTHCNERKAHCWPEPLPFLRELWRSLSPPTWALNQTCLT